jgi:hypothetical protein
MTDPTTGERHGDWVTTPHDWRKRDRRLRPRVDRLEGRSLLATMPIVGVAAASPVAAGAQGPIAGVDADRVSTDLLIGYDLATGLAFDDKISSLAANNGINMSSLVGDDSGAATSLMTDDEGRVGVDITTGDPQDLAPDLQALGMDVVSILPQYDQVQGFLPWSRCWARRG